MHANDRRNNKVSHERDLEPRDQIEADPMSSSTPASTSGGGRRRRSLWPAIEVASSRTHLTTTRRCRDHRVAIPDRTPDAVPSHWRTGGPIKLASDRFREISCVGA